MLVSILLFAAVAGLYGYLYYTRTASAGESQADASTLKADVTAAVASAASMEALLGAAGTAFQAATTSPLSTLLTAVSALGTALTTVVGQAEQGRSMIEVSTYIQSALDSSAWVNALVPQLTDVNVNADALQAFYACLGGVDDGFTSVPYVDVQEALDAITACLAPPSLSNNAYVHQAALGGFVNALTNVSTAATGLSDAEVGLSTLASSVQAPATAIQSALAGNFFTDVNTAGTDLGTAWDALDTALSEVSTDAATQLTALSGMVVEAMALETELAALKK